MGFVSGLILGAIIGAVFSVAADRLWRAKENRLRLRIAGGPFFESGGASGLSISIINRGHSTLPPATPCLFHPRFGRQHLFSPKEAEHAAELLPGQEANYRCFMWANGRNLNMPSLQAPLRAGAGAESINLAEISFRIIIENGDRVLYENRRLGHAVAAAFEKCKESGAISLMGEDIGPMQSNPQPLMQWLVRYLSGREIEVEDGRRF